MENRITEAPQPQGATLDSPYRIPDRIESPLFAFHRLNLHGISMAEEVAATFNHALAVLEHICPGGREFAICKTKLEEACFYAKKAVALHPHNQVLLADPKPIFNFREVTSEEYARMSPDEQKRCEKMSPTLYRMHLGPAMFGGQIPGGNQQEPSPSVPAFAESGS